MQIAFLNAVVLMVLQSDSCNYKNSANEQSNFGEAIVFCIAILVDYACNNCLIYCEMNYIFLLRIKLGTIWSPNCLKTAKTLGNFQFVNYETQN